MTLHPRNKGIDPSIVFRARIHRAHGQIYRDVANQVQGDLAFSLLVRMALFVQRFAVRSVAWKGAR